ncbi:hypothetical protein TIFTF001_011415 [Ficus carica]|uniref:Uncharacterized protein n=1 Tax=Ficus carica TaxID=3494 RepID=A0AA88AE21_FICCA|nr:hypothetical protein TIFTF001_011415 [Ficus carica]
MHPPISDSCEKTIRTSILPRLPSSPVFGRRRGGHVVVVRHRRGERGSPSVGRRSCGGCSPSPRGAWVAVGDRC